MKTVTKSECLALIERLESGKCRCLKYNVECFCEKPDRPVMIGDVLGPISIAWTEEQQRDNWLRLCELWCECGFNKSLQEIIDKQPEELSKEASDLFLFLNEIL